MAKRRKWVRPPLPLRITTEGGKYYYDEEAAQHAVEFFENWLVHIEGEWQGEPFVLADWQREEIIKPLFGWKVRKTGFRRFRRAYIEIPKKNGKSMLASGIGLYLTLADDEPGAYVYAAATSEDQARVVFDASVALVEASPKLGHFCRPTKSRIVVPVFGSFFQVLSKTSESKHGIKPHGVIIDELHAHKREELYKVLTEGSTDTRRQPLIFVITTAGTDRTSIGWKEHLYALSVLKGEIEDEELLVVIYAAAEDDDWRNPAVWAKANPSVGITMGDDALERAYLQAKNQPDKINSFKQLRLNIWSSVSRRWLDPSAWAKCRTALDEEALLGRPCWGAFDLSSTKDTTALVWLFELNDKLVLLPRFFVPRAGIEAREAGDVAKYKRWVADGHLTATDGARIDYRALRRQIDEDSRRFNVRAIGYDGWNAGETVHELEEAGFEMIQIPQGAKLSEPAKDFEKRMTDGQLAHPGNPVLDWNAGNVEAIDSAGGNVKLVKPLGQATGTQRIDGIIASVMALEVYRHRDKEGSAYEKHGLRIIQR